LLVGLGSLSLAFDSLPYLFTGRLLSGVALGLGMTVGTSWVTELTVRAGQGLVVGARRASLSLTAGFGAGAGVAGMLAQWSPWPGSLPYLVHVVLTAFVLVAVVRWSTGTRPDLGGRRPRATGPRLPRFASSGSAACTSYGRGSSGPPGLPTPSFPRRWPT